MPDAQSEYLLEELLHVEQQSGISCIADANIRIETCQQPAGPRLPVSDGAIKAQGADVASRDPAISNSRKR